MFGKVLVINPGSTSTKVSVYDNNEVVVNSSLTHDVQDLEKFAKVIDQYEYRKDAIIAWLNENKIKINELICVVARGGLVRPISSGTYLVDGALIDDLKIGVQGEHASNLGGIIAKEIADSIGVKAFIVDPVAVDEFIDEARISGLKEVKRQSLVHALNIRANAIKHTKELKLELNKENFIIAHLGGGISVVPMRCGRMIDANNANEMGPFSPERTGSMPVGGLLKFIKEGYFKNYNECKKFITGKGGLVAYLNTNDMRDVEKMINDGDTYAESILEAMAYQIAKEIGACAAVLKGQVHSIILTGGVAYTKRLCKKVEEMTSFIAPNYVYPGEDEMLALYEGAIRVLDGTENYKIYEEEIV